MTPAERAIALAGLAALKTTAAELFPVAAPLATIALDAVMEAVASEHEDPEAVLLEARAQLRATIAAAMRAKFPNG